MVAGNEGWFKQMLINLIDNAIKYTPDSGDVYVNVTNKGDSVEFSIRDTGIGIDEDHISRLLKDFIELISTVPCRWRNWLRFSHCKTHCFVF